MIEYDDPDYNEPKLGEWIFPVGVEEAIKKRSDSYLKYKFEVSKELIDHVNNLKDE